MSRDAIIFGHFDVGHQQVSPLDHSVVNMSLVATTAVGDQLCWSFLEIHISHS